MSILTFKKSNKNINNVVDILNIIFKPLGYNVVAGTNNKNLYFLNESRRYSNCIKLSDFEEKKLNDEEKLYILSTELIGGTNIFLKIYENNRVTVEINDVNGKTIAGINYKKTALNSESFYCGDTDIVVTSASIKMYNNTVPGETYKIMYDQLDETLTFEKENIYHDNYALITMPRGSSEKTRLVFETYNHEESNKIESYGDESYNQKMNNEIMHDIGIPYTPFEVTYTKKTKDGKKSVIFWSQNSVFKHFSNCKIICNKNVRSFIDEFIQEYKSRFPEWEFRNGIIGGYLFDEYIHGQENNNAAANNMLSQINFPVKNQITRKRNKKNVKSHK